MSRAGREEVESSLQTRFQEDESLEDMYENSTSLDNSIKKFGNKMKRSECQLESSEKRRLL